jgi:hypothetical protein
MKSLARPILVVMVASISVVVIASSSAHLGFGAGMPSPQPGLSQAQLLDLDTAARKDLQEVASKVRFHARFPLAPPTGFYYSHVVFELGHPERGFAVWMERPGAADRGIHIIEAPDVPDAAKNTLSLPNLVAVTLPNGTWMTLQKADDPWKGLWIYATVMDGVHIEVDGADRGLVESVAGSL